MACLGTPGAMNTTPKATVEMLLVLTPLHVITCSPYRNAET